MPIHWICVTNDSKGPAPSLLRFLFFRKTVYLPMLGSDEDLIWARGYGEWASGFFPFSLVLTGWRAKYLSGGICTWPSVSEPENSRCWCYLHCWWRSGRHSSPSGQEAWPFLAYPEHLGVIWCATNKLKLDLQELDRFQGPGNNPFWQGLLIPLPLSSPPFPAVKETLAAYFSLSLALWKLQPTLPSKPCRVTLALIGKSYLFKGYGAFYHQTYSS